MNTFEGGEYHSLTFFSENGINCDEIQCISCHRTFCCKDCRRYHEIISHAIKIDCSLCRGLNFIYDPKCLCDQELVTHIVANHLPLHCSKCGTTFSRIEDMDDFKICYDIADIDIDEQLSNTEINSAFEHLISEMNASSTYTVSTPKNNMNDSVSCSSRDDKTPKLWNGVPEQQHMKPKRYRATPYSRKSRDTISKKTEHYTTTPKSHVAGLQSVKIVSTSTPTNADSILRSQDNTESPILFDIKSEAQHFMGDSTKETQNATKLKSIIISRDNSRTMENGESSSSFKNKKVTFAIDTVFDRREALRHRRLARRFTPCPPKRKTLRHPRLQALINMFDKSRSLENSPNVIKRNEADLIANILPNIPQRAICFKDESSSITEDILSHKESFYETCDEIAIDIDKIPDGNDNKLKIKLVKFSNEVIASLQDCLSEDGLSDVHAEVRFRLKNKKFVQYKLDIENNNIKYRIGFEPNWPFQSSACKRKL